MIQHEGDRFGIKARVEGIQHGAGIGTPKWHSNISGVLLSIAATVSPAPTPCAASADARRRARSYSWRQV
jgi:hypothetical protein